MAASVPSSSSSSAAGRPASRSRPYLLNHRNTTVFRIRVPADVQNCLGRKEYRRSLGPCSALDAKSKSLRLAAAAHEVFAFVREAQAARRLSCPAMAASGMQGYTTMAVKQEKNTVTLRNKEHDGVSTTDLSGRTLDSLSDAEIRAIAEDWLLVALKGHGIMTAAAGRLRQREGGGLSPEQVHEANQEQAEAAKRVRTKHTAIHKAALSQREYSHIRHKAETILDANGVNHTGQSESPQYTKACEELTRANITFYRLQDQYEEGDFAVYDREIARLEADHRQRQSPPMPTASSPEGEGGESNGIRLTDAIQEFFREKTLDGSWRPKVAEMERSKFELFQAVIDPDGTLLVRDIRAKHLSRYKEILYLMPANTARAMKP